MERAENRSKAKNLLAQFTRFIRDGLDQMRNDNSEEALDPPVGEYLSAKQEEPPAHEERAERLSDTIQDVKIRVTETKPPSADAQSTQEESTQENDDAGDIEVVDRPGEGGRGGEHPGQGGGDGGGHRPGDGGGDIPIEHRKSLSTIPASRVRNMERDRSKGLYRIIFTPRVSANNGVLELFMSAESQTYDAKILSAVCASQPDLVIVGNKIRNIAFTAEQALQIDVQLDYHDYCPMEVRAYGNKI